MGSGRTLYRSARKESGTSWSGQKVPNCFFLTQIFPYSSRAGGRGRVSECSVRVFPRTLAHCHLVRLPQNHFPACVTRVLRLRVGGGWDATILPATEEVIRGRCWGCMESRTSGQTPVTAKSSVCIFLQGNCCVCVYTGVSSLGGCSGWLRWHRRRLSPFASGCILPSLGRRLAEGLGCVDRLRFLLVVWADVPAHLEQAGLSVPVEVLADLAAGKRGWHVAQTVSTVRNGKVLLCVGHHNPNCHMGYPYR